MVYIWFGLDGTGIQRSVDFHWLLGPILMVAFAFLGNTLFLTILVSMLSTTFSTIVSNATAEIQFRRAVLTLEGVKSDAIFAFFPPANILALFILGPLKFVVTPRWFHKINVASVRFLNAPLLLVVGAIERRSLWAGARRQREAPLTRTQSRVGLWDFRRGFSVHGDIQAVFDNEQSDSSEEEEETPHTHEITSSHDAEENEFARDFGQETANKLSRKTTMTNKSRRDSVAPFGGLSKRLTELLDGASDGEEGGSVLERLETLEKTTKRIEMLLIRLVDGMDDGGSGSGPDGETGTIQDLDKSGTADLDD